MGTAEGPVRYRLHVIPILRRPAGWLFREWLAITLGGHILAWRPLTERELRHEVAHVRQWRRHGPLFGARYLLASIDAWRRGGHWYRDNRFEVEARATETPPAERR